MSEPKTVGVIGAGSFGTAVANILAKNVAVLLYLRDEEAAGQMRATRVTRRGQRLHDNITPITQIDQVADRCSLIFPVIPSANFRSMMKELAPNLRPDHLVVHGTKGLDIGTDLAEPIQITREEIKTMSEVIMEESVVIRVGCLAGPNLANELNEGQPAATVVASQFDEVIKECQRVLRSRNFQVYGNKDLLGVELAGILKNAIAIAAGALTGMGYGENARALLITRGMGEMIYLGKAMGAEASAFLGLAGIGDLMATCSSRLSRNFTVGYRLAKGETLNEILQTMDEVAEGVKTIKIAKSLSDHYLITAPIIQALYRVLFQDLPIEKGVAFLMRYPAHIDADYI